MASAPIGRFAKFLASKGRRLTSHTVCVVDVAYSLSGTFSGEDLVGHLRGQVSRASIYRTLMGLTEAELLRQVEFNGQVVYVAVADDYCA